MQNPFYKIKSFVYNLLIGNGFNAKPIHKIRSFIHNLLVAKRFNTKPFVESK